MGEDAVPLSPRVDTYVTGPTPPESSRAQAALVSDERVMDAFAASAKAEQRRQNQRRREESRRSAGEVLLPLDVRQEPCSSNEQGRPSDEAVQRADEEAGYGRRQVRIGLWPRDGRRRTDGVEATWTDGAAAVS